MLDRPTYLIIPTLYEGEPAKISWESVEGAISYQLDCVYDETFEQASVGRSWTSLEVLGETWTQIDSEDLSWDDLSVFLWIQERISNVILFHSITSIIEDDSVSENDAVALSVSNVSVFPNPIRSNENIRLEFTGSKAPKDVNLTVYNIRGQRVSSQIVSEFDISVKDLNISSSGVYFMRIKWMDSGLEFNRVQRLLLIK